MKRAWIITGILLFSFTAFSQGMRTGSLVVKQDSMLNILLAKYQAAREQLMQSEDNKGIPGYRIQIFFDSGINSGERARKAKEDFELLFPEIPGYVTWKAPNFRVRVGDFRTRLDADRALQNIAEEYPNAWVIKDEINFPPLF